VPDGKAVWAFREVPTSKGLVEKLFEQFRDYLVNKGLILKEGKMIDASFTVAPRQRNTREENKAPHLLPETFCSNSITEQ